MLKEYKIHELGVIFEEQAKKYDEKYIPWSGIPYFNIPRAFCCVIEEIIKLKEKNETT